LGSSIVVVDDVVVICDTSEFISNVDVDDEDDKVEEDNKGWVDDATKGIEASF